MADDIRIQPVKQDGKNRVDFYRIHTLVIGSGAAGLNAAVQLKVHGVEDVLVISEGLEMGTSINTGSDKQTYYKLGMYGDQPDSPAAVAEALYAGGAMHGDIALVEAGLSARSFLNLVNLGVPFPRDRYGQFVGYKTDHDPRQRATSVGPYTSREMCLALSGELKRRKIPFHEKRQAVALLTEIDNNRRRVYGAVVLNMEAGELRWEAYICENVVFAVGGPGGIYKTSVYPDVHTGAIGLAFLAGARGRNLPESQYGLASIKHRWNVSGSYMQVVPRIISTDKDGRDEREFLHEYFSSPGEMHSAVFLKGYQWPFDVRKAAGGSSLVDILVYRETVKMGRRVFLDYRKNSIGFDVDDLSEEAREYLVRSKAVEGRPIDRLLAMNPDAYELYKTNGIDLAGEPLEIAVCAQHNNGGLAADFWWQSENIDRLFPVGEVNGSHGVTRPGGSALNSGQVGSLRAAEYIAARCRGWTVDEVKGDFEILEINAGREISELSAWLDKGLNSSKSWRDHRFEFQDRMTASGAHIRSESGLKQAVDEARSQWVLLQKEGCSWKGEAEKALALQTRQLCFAHVVYLESTLFAVESGLGSRGSAMVLSGQGKEVHPSLMEEWHFASEDEKFRQMVLETDPMIDEPSVSSWNECRPMPAQDAWFETTWAAFKKGEIYD